MNKRFWVCAVGAAALFVAAPVHAQTKIERTPAKPIASVEGVDTFQAYCASCHGPNAKGDGPAAKALSKTPADLTMITKRHGRIWRSEKKAVRLRSLFRRTSLRICRCRELRFCFTEES